MTQISQVTVGNITVANDKPFVLFGGMSKYISSAGAGVTNILWVRNQDVHVGGIHSAGFPFPENNHSRQYSSIY